MVNDVLLNDRRQQTSSVKTDLEVSVPRRPRQALVERAHRDFVASSTPRAVATVVAELEKEEGDSTETPPPPAYEVFVESLSEDLPPLAMGILEACEGNILSVLFLEL